MSFTYLQPVEIDETLELLARYGEDARLLAGGAALVLLIRQKLLAPQALISLEGVQALRYSQVEAEGLHLGATNRLSAVAADEQVLRRFPALAQACGVVGNVRVRNQATLGGNLAEADYASDPPAVLCALQAVVTATSSRGARQIPLSEFFRGFYTTALQPDELLSDIFVPGLPPGARTVYLKYKSRSSEDRPCVGVAAVGVLQDGICQDLRVAVGAACEIPFRSPDVERQAQGQALSDELIGEVARSYAAGIKPLEDLRGSAWYRRQMVQVFVRRALEEVRSGDR
jgi:carbon-monoxide dehydrogenase medium subunit